MLEALEVDYVDESEVLTPADEANHIDKWGFKIPFVCGATNLGEALRRIGEGAAMIRSKGEAGTGDIVEAVRHLRSIRGRDPPPGHARRHGAGDRGQGAAVAAGSRAPGRARPEAARRALLRRRDRHPGRRVAGDAARRRGRVRGLGHLQVRGPGDARGGDRRGDHALPGRGARRPGLRGPRAWRCSRSSRASSKRASCSRTAVVDRRPRPAGRLRSTHQDAAGPRRRRARGPRARRPRRARRAGDAGRRVDDDDARHQARGARGAAARRSCAPASRCSAPAPG